MRFILARSLASRKRKGAMLVEAAIGLTLTAVVLMVIMATFTFTVNALVAMRDKETGTMVALGVLDELEGVELKDLEKYETTSLDEIPGYTVEIMFSESPSESTRSLDVTVTASRTGSKSPVTLTRNFSDSGYLNAGFFD